MYDASDDNQPAIPRPVFLPRQRPDSTGRPTPKVPGQRKNGTAQ